MADHEEDEFSLTPQDPGRRKVMLGAAAGLSVGVGAIAAAPGLAFIGYPLYAQTVTGSHDYLPAGQPRQFSESPVKIELFADKADAWNRFEDVKVGSAWVVKLGEELVAFSTVCPHLGCAIDYDPEAKKFKCPCHRSVFSMDGTVENGPSPRPMDRLDVEKKEKLVAIRYRRFKQGVEAKETIG